MIIGQTHKDKYNSKHIRTYAIADYTKVNTIIVFAKADVIANYIKANTITVCAMADAKKKLQ